ncbi:MAG: hypothetical protein GDA55_01955 [Cellvibrionales bacterium]|nr:hypothetical protein [Cellvibrionales bacterium]
MSSNKVRPIHSERDHAAALARVEVLLDAADRSRAEDDERDASPQAHLPHSDLMDK